MGTAGNRNGYKVFSINTTVRNPKRNTDFLKQFQPYSGKIFDDELSFQYYFDCITNGVYTLSEVSEVVKRKIASGETLTATETIQAIRNNPQATGIHGRVMTQLRALKDQGFLKFEKGEGKYYRITITSLGQDLIEEKIDPTIIYSKAMIGLHANSPLRIQLLNRSRPFLNTIFVINEVKKKWHEMGNDAKGILFHEFGTFVLSMKDCDYKKAADEIIKYRLKYKYNVNINYLENYLEQNGILPLDENSLCKDYPDEVFRKFEMTGLVTRRGTHAYPYIDFSSYNERKIETILDYYKNYKFIDFNDQDDYYRFLNNVVIPWQKDESLRREIVLSKQQILNIQVDPKITLEEQEEQLDRIFFSTALQRAVDALSLEQISKELLILAGRCKEKSKYSDIPESLRLEYMLALLMGKRYGTSGLISSIIYNEDGVPLHVAPSGKCDIIYLHPDGSFILEPTMLRGRDQQLNSETSNVARHVKNVTSKAKMIYHAMMVAPYVHPDVASYFQFVMQRDNVEIAPINIDIIVALVTESKNIKELALNFGKIVKFLGETDSNRYADEINRFSISC